MQNDDMMIGLALRRFDRSVTVIRSYLQDRSHLNSESGLMTTARDEFNKAVRFAFAIKNTLRELEDFAKAENAKANENN